MLTRSTSKKIMQRFATDVPRYANVLLRGCTYTDAFYVLRCAYMHVKMVYNAWKQEWNCVQPCSSSSERRQIYCTQLQTVWSEFPRYVVRFAAKRGNCYLVFCYSIPPVQVKSRDSKNVL